MAIITTNAFLDDAPGTRTAGETWTMNGARLTVRTDTRWYGGTNPAPAGMLGSLGSLTVSATLGGGLTFDATNVRWLAFSGGTGTVPAINTAITQGGVTGTLLGVWSSLTAAPTAVGAAMPATGWLKFREVTGGSFAAGALSGISASATGADVNGWIEVVMDESTAITIPRLGDHTTRGARFFLSNTTGVAGQILQVPTNGGGANTFCPGVYVETGVGTDVYEFYNAVTAGTGFNTTNLGTDARAKFVQNLGNGQMRIGSNGTDNIGFVPPSGCRTWVPNIFLRATTAANRALNVAPNSTLGTRPDWITTSGGIIDLENVYGDWYLLLSSAFSVRIRNSAFHDSTQFANIASPLDIDGLNVGIHNAAANIALILTNCFEGGTVSNGRFFRTTAAVGGHAVALTTCVGQTLSAIEAGVVTFARNAGGLALSLNQCIGVQLNNCTTFNTAVALVTCLNININNLTIIDRMVGVSISTTPLTVVNSTASCNNITIDGISFGTFANVAPAGAVFGATQSNNIRCQNVGTRAAPLAVGATPPRIFLDGGANNGITAKRIYLAATTTSPFTTINTSKNLLFENLQGNFAQTQALASVSSRFKGIGATRNTTAQLAVYGTDWADYFSSATVGNVSLAFNEPVGDKLPFYTVNSGTPNFTSAGGLAMFAVGDQITWSMDYFALGHTSFQNVAPVMSGGTIGNYTVEYRLDTGTGFTGAFKALTGANLSGETISPSDGFRLQIRITTNNTNTTPITFLGIATNTTALAQENLYPLVSNPRTYTFTGLETGTEVVLFNSSNVEIDREVISGTTYTYNYTFTGSSSTGNYALIWKDDKLPIKFTNITLGDVDQSIPITQSDDLVYTNTYTLGATIDYLNKLHIMDTGTTVLPLPNLYSQWKDSIRVSNNAQYDFAYDALGNTPVGGNFIPVYIFQINGWKIRPQEANHTLNVTNGILVGSGDPFVNTVGAFTVRINYEQPVSAIAVAGAGGATAADVIAARDAILVEVDKRLKTTTYLGLK